MSKENTGKVKLIELSHNQMQKARRILKANRMLCDPIAFELYLIELGIKRAGRYINPDATRASLMVGFFANKDTVRKYRAKVNNILNPNYTKGTSELTNLVVDLLIKHANLDLKRKSKRVDKIDLLFSDDAIEDAQDELDISKKISNELMAKVR